MSKYLKKFENHTQYENYINGSGAILPNVSICTTEGDVHYNPYVDPSGGHEYVEIGGLKWATMNIGANSITDYGLYFAWAETSGYTADQVTGSSEPHRDFNINDYKYYDSNVGYTKYNSTDGKTVLDVSDDGAIANWGGSWRMPTVAEYAALGNAVNTAYTSNYQGSGIAGLVCTDKTDNSKVLFFPACGNASYGNISYRGNNGYYWTSSLGTEGPVGQTASYMTFNASRVYWKEDANRLAGKPIRAILDI